MNDNEMKAMLIEYMGRGFLDNIIAMFKQDTSLCRFIAAMLGDANIRVRLGVTALVEELAGEHWQLSDAVPGLIELLKHENPTIRGDAAAMLGIIKDAGAIAALQEALQDSHPGVQEAARDALAEIGR